MEGNDTQDDTELSEMDYEKENMVIQEEAKKFLDSHNDIEDVGESDLSQDTDIVELQEDKEPAQEQNIEQFAENLDVPELKDNVDDALSQRQRKKRNLEIPLKSVKKYAQGSHNEKRRPAH